MKFDNTLVYIRFYVKKRPSFYVWVAFFIPSKWNNFAVLERVSLAE